jgi:hypothetical protein
MKAFKGAPVKGAMVHGALLVVMLVYGYKVWTRDKTAQSTTVGTVVLWNKAESELVAVEFAAPNRTVKLEKRGDGAAAYWWGTETKETPAPTTPAAPTNPLSPGDGPGMGSGAAPGGGSAAKPAAGSATTKPAAGSASTTKPAPGSASTTKPAAGSASTAKPPAGAEKAASGVAPPAPPKPPAAKPAAGSGAAPGPAKMAEPDLLAYQPAGGGSAAGSASTSKPAAGSGSAAKPPKPPAAGSAAGSAAKPTAAGSAAGSAAKPTAAGSAAGSAAKPAAGSATSASDPPPDDPLGASAIGASDAPKPVTTTREFPVGDAADKLLKGLANARALRDLGKLDEEQKKEYKLDETSTTLSIVFRSGTKSFVVGGSVYGGRDKYVLDTDSGKAYVLSGDLLSPLEQGESGLRLSDPRGFDASTIQRVTLSAGGKARTATRMVADAAAKPDADPHAPPATKTKTWGDPATNKPDQTLANFIDNADRLKPTKYEATLDPKSMTEIVKLTYQDDKGSTLGTVTLYKREKPAENVVDPANPPPPTIEYYVMTEKTRVPGLVPKSAGDKIDQDVATVFSAQ